MHTQADIVDRYA